MSDFNTQDDYYEEEEVQRQTRARERRRLPLWPLAVILLVLLAAVISFGPDLFRPSPQPTVGIVPTITPAALPTAAFPTPTATTTPKPTPTPTLPTEITVGGHAKVVGAEADELSYRSGPGLNYARLSIVKDGTILEVLEGPEEADGYTWWRLEDEDGFIGWAADDWLEPTLP